MNIHGKADHCGYGENNPPMIVHYMFMKELNGATSLNPTSQSRRSWQHESLSFNRTGQLIVL